jgi:hypothetical protein
MGAIFLRLGIASLVCLFAVVAYAGPLGIFGRHRSTCSADGCSAAERDHRLAPAVVKAVKPDQGIPDQSKRLKLIRR